MILSRDEMMACIIALDKEQPYRWRNKALKKLEKAMGLNHKEASND